MVTGRVPIAYGLVDFNVTEWISHTRVMAADGSGDRSLPMPDDAQFNYSAVWSNDGMRLVMLRGGGRPVMATT